MLRRSQFEDFAAGELPPSQMRRGRIICWIVVALDAAFLAWLYWRITH